MSRLERLPAGGFAGIALCSLAAVGVALVSQHLFGMQPCPWCVLQRVIFIAIAIVAAVGFLWRNPAIRTAAATVTLLLCLCGVAASLWQHFKAAASASCSLTLADKIVSGLRLDAVLPNVFEPRASCADAAVTLLGIPYDFWSLALFALVAVASLQLARRR